MKDDSLIFREPSLQIRAPITRMNWLLINLFVVLGPLGNLLTPQLISHAFRSYYLVLLLFPLLYSCFYRWQAAILVACLPYFLYSLASAIWFPHHEFTSREVLFRFFLLFSQFLFVLGASSHFTSFHEVKKLILRYVKSVFLSVLVGYCFYLGFSFKFFSLSLLEKFSVLTQMGYGFLRFSPGSYPNEYGTITSFTLAVTALIAQKNLFSSKKILYFFYCLTLGALLLTTTKAAYLSYLGSLLYLWWKDKRSLAVVVIPCVVIFCVALILSFFHLNAFAVLSIGFPMRILELPSIEERMLFWKIALEEWKSHLWFGHGFSYYSNLHNLYLQLLCEMGLVGSCVLAMAFFLSLRGEEGYWRIKKQLSEEEELVRKIVHVGLIHVLWFGLSNHNLNHHLTWFTLLLCFSLRALYQCEKKKVG